MPWCRLWRIEEKQIPPLRYGMTNKFVYTNFERALSVQASHVQGKENAYGGLNPASIRI
jgi:predicted NACHT family NTPase